MQKRIMAIVAHADDLEVYCGGTMAKFVEAGYDGVEVLLTASMAGADIDGQGYRRSKPEQVIPHRHREALEAARILGIARVERLDYQNTLYSDGDAFVWLGDEGFDTRHPAAHGPLLPAVAINEKLLEPLVELLGREEPEIVIGQHMFSGSEHVLCGHIINLAFRKALRKGASLGQLWLPVAARHCTWSSDLRVYPSPNILIDISAQWDKKQAAMLAHASQKLDKELDKIRLIDQYWGIANECALAEPFFTLCDGRYR